MVNVRQLHAIQRVCETDKMTRRVQRRRTVKRKRKQKGGFKDAIKALSPFGPIIAKTVVKRLVPKKKKVRRRRRRQVYEYVEKRDRVVSSIHINLLTIK